MKKAFTLSEALVTLAILGVLAAILIPVINDVRPDKDKLTYKKALYNMQAAISQAMDTSLYDMAANVSAYWKDANVGDSSFCEAVADSLNTSGAVDCTSQSSYDHPNFITTDGIRYWGLEGKFVGDNRTIYIDRNIGTREKDVIAAKRDKIGEDTGMKIRVRYDGRIDTAPEDTFEAGLVENSLQVNTGR